MNEQLSILDVIDMLLRRWWLILIFTIIGGVAVFSYTEVLIQPTYASEGALYVNSNRLAGQTDVTMSTLNASKQLVATYAEILKRNTFLKQVSRDVNGKYSADQIKRMLSLSSVNETEVMSVRVTGADPEDVYEIAHSVLMRAPDELIRVVEAGSVKLLDDASIPNVPIAPNVKRNTLVGILVGMVLGGVVVILLELFDTRIKSGEEITTRYDEPLLGEIPSLIEEGR